MKNNWFSVLGYVLCGWIFSLPVIAAQDLVVEITHGTTSATAIAVSPFQWQGASAPTEDVAQIISDDLAHTAQFRSLAQDQLPSHPTQQASVNFAEWKQVAAEYLTIGRIQPNPQGYQFEFELFDVYGQHLLDARRGQASHLRDLAHHISDQIYERLTGMRGIFSTRILYVTLERPHPKQTFYRLQMADADGYRAQTIFQSPEPILSPSWSSDGKRVAYVSFHQGGKPAIYIHELATGQQEKIAAYKGTNGAPAWSPDGRSLAMTLSKDGNPEIYLYQLEDKSLLRLTKNLSIDTEPRWYPDGASLIFTSNRGGSPQLYQLGLADHSVRRLTYEGNYNARGEITRDGRYLVMVHREQGLFHIATQDLMKGHLNILTSTQLDESPSVAPNGNMIIYATLRGNEGVLAVTSIDGRAKFFLPARQGEVREPVWSPFR